MDDSVIKHVMPHSEEAELAVIGAMLMDEKAVDTVSDILVKDDFYNRSYGMLYDTMVQLKEAGLPVDMVQIQQKAKSLDYPPEATGIEVIRKVTEYATTSAGVERNAEIIRNKSVLRKLIRTLGNLSENAYADKRELVDILADAEDEVAKIVRNTTSKEFEPIQDIVVRAIKLIENANKSGGKITGIASGFRDLDWYTRGFQKSDLIIIAARPAMGKTALALNFAFHAAVYNNYHVAVFSLEMPKDQLVNRLIAMDANVDAGRIRSGDIEAKEWTPISESASRIGVSNLHIDDTPGITVNELRSKCRSLAAKNQLDMIVIDYIQLMTGSGKAESRQNEVAEISRGLKGVARELNVPLLALSQLGRAVESRPDKRPMLSDLRESGAIEQDADMVTFIYRDDYYHKDSETKNVSEVIIAKHRNGAVGTVKLAWIPEYTKFADLIRKEDEQYVDSQKSP